MCSANLIVSYGCWSVNFTKSNSLHCDSIQGQLAHSEGILHSWWASHEPHKLMLLVNDVLNLGFGSNTLTPFIPCIKNANGIQIVLRCDSAWLHSHLVSTCVSSDHTEIALSSPNKRNSHCPLTTLCHSFFYKFCIIQLKFIQYTRAWRDDHHYSARHARE